MSKYVLTFDTSSNDIVLNLAAFDYEGTKLLSAVARTHPAPRAANTQLLTRIDKAMQQAGVAPRELAALGVGTTLGSYTGVRIGIATAKGIAQALGIPLYGLAIDEEKLSPDHLLDTFMAAHTTQTGDPSTVLPHYTMLSYAEEAERKEHPERSERATLALAQANEVMGWRSHPARYANIDPSGDPNAGTITNTNNAEQPAAPADHKVGAFTLRALTPLDQDALASLASEIAYFNWTPQQYADELQSIKSIWYGAFKPGKDGAQQLVGYIGANTAVAEADLHQVAVHPKARKHGIATALFELLSEQLAERRATSLTLEVREQNKQAQALYEKLGFKQVGRRENYYRDPTDNALVLKKQLSYTAQNESLLLGIETSCDETAVAVMQGTKLLSNVVASQVKFHARFGGVVPEIASRKHSEAIVATTDRAMRDAATAAATTPFSALSGIAVTDRPGLIGALVVGQAYAKGLAWALGKPLYPINHLEGHLYACVVDPNPDLPNNDLPNPHLALIVSGGHTALVYSPAPHHYQTLGETLDDAAGEAFDKVAKVLGLGYPGGPILSKLADQGDPHAIDFPRAMMHSKDYAFSLSGLKTAVITYIREAEEKGEPLSTSEVSESAQSETARTQRSDGGINIPNVAASFQQAIVDVQVAKAVRAARETGVKHFIMAGGVAAIMVLREELIAALAGIGVQTHIPPFKYCGDNAAMIVRTAAARLEAGVLKAAPLDADCSSSGPLDTGA